MFHATLPENQETGPTEEAITVLNFDSGTYKILSLIIQELRDSSTVEP